MWRYFFLILVLLAAPLAAAQDQPVTLREASTANLTTLDPQRTGDALTLDVVENLFLGLLDVDPQTGALRPELAEGWEVGNEGYTYTFRLRADVPWVRWDPMNRQTEVLRTVAAGDVVSAARRACDPRLGAPLAGVLDGLVAGCGAALHTPVGDVDAGVLGDIGVEAPNDTTVIFHLEQPAAHFPAVAASPVLYPVPQDIIDAYDTAWSEPGNLAASGPYLLDEHIRYVRRTLVQNPHLPADLRGPGNVARWEVNMVEDQATALDLYLNGRLDTAAVPLSARSALPPDHAGEVQLVPTRRLVYIGFAHDKPPFDNPSVRRAFSAAIDRAALTAQIYPGIPMAHFTPPGVPGAPPANEIGAGYNPDYAREQLAQAGYGGCQGFPEVDMLVAVPKDQLDFLLAAWEDKLGCDLARFHITVTDLETLRDWAAYGGLNAARPHLWTDVYPPDYPDVYHWLGDGLHCRKSAALRRPCGPADELIDRLREQRGAAARAGLAQQIEAAFFDVGGEMPTAPLYVWVQARAFRSGYSAPVPNGRFHLDWVTLGPA